MSDLPRMLSKREIELEELEEAKYVQSLRDNIEKLQEQLNTAKKYIEESYKADKEDNKLLDLIIEAVAKLKSDNETAKKYIEHVIGTINHDGRLGTIQTDWILPYLEKALAAIGVDNDIARKALVSTGTTGCPAGLTGRNGLTDENFIEVFELQEQLNTAKKALTEAIGDIEQLNGSDDTIKYYKQALAAIGGDDEL
ncbi:hypothetical protein [Lactococcus lactis]|uniref:hypothetical protein n=1 Tax=Lactococcus lactis TaxID=1358 RepID=UPI0020B66A5F|nr:hypothetical protein [Lactococcus lactis]